MPKLPVVKPREVISAIKKAGFEYKRGSGSHQLFFNQEKNLRATIPYHNKVLKLKTLSSILKQAQLSVEEFKDLL